MGRPIPFPPRDVMILRPGEKYIECNFGVQQGIAKPRPLKCLFHDDTIPGVTIRPPKGPKDTWFWIALISLLCVAGGLACSCAWKLTHPIQLEAP